MRYRLFDIMLAVMLALAVGASAAAESLAAGAKPTVQASAKPEARDMPSPRFPTPISGTTASCGWSCARWASRCF